MALSLSYPSGCAFATPDGRIPDAGFALGCWRSAGQAELSRTIHPRARTRAHRPDGEGAGRHRAEGGSVKGHGQRFSFVVTRSVVSADSGVRRRLPHRSGIGTERIGCRGFTGPVPPPLLISAFVPNTRIRRRSCQGPGSQRAHRQGWWNQRSCLPIRWFQGRARRDLSRYLVSPSSTFLLVLPVDQLSP